MKIKRLHDEAILPKYATDGSSAFDICAYKKPIWHKNNNGLWVTIIESGWSFQIPHEHGLFIFSRSGHAFKNDTTLANSVGILDYDYRGQLMVKLICMDEEHPNIEAKQAVAQCALLETPRCYFCVVDELDDTARGINGFGSTDKETL